MSLEIAKGREPKTYRKVDLSNTADEVSSSKAGIVGIIAHSANVADVFLQIYNAKAADVTVGTTTPKLTIPIPAGGGSAIDVVHNLFFSIAISVAVTTTYAGGAAPASAVLAEVIYL